MSEESISQNSWLDFETFGTGIGYCYVGQSYHDIHLILGILIHFQKYVNDIHTQVISTGRNKFEFALTPEFNA